jgi:hypothetical protein
LSEWSTYCKPPATADAKKIIELVDMQHE